MTKRTLRRQASAIFRAALRAADPHDAVMRYLARRDYSRFRHVYVIGAGKAGASMAQAAERALGRRRHRRPGQRQVRPRRQTAPHRVERMRPPGARRARRGRRRAHRGDRFRCRRRRPGAVPDFRAAPRRCCRCPRRPSRWRKSRRSRGCCSRAAPTSTKSTPSASTCRPLRAGNWRAWRGRQEWKRCWFPT